MGSDPVARPTMHWLMKFHQHRIADRTLLRLVAKWLQVGAMEGGVVSRSDDGTPQGGPLSPLLANIYLHYLLDLWFDHRFKPSVAGTCTEMPTTSMVFRHSATCGGMSVGCGFWNYASEVNDIGVHGRMLCRVRGFTPCQNLFFDSERRAEPGSRML